MDLEWIIELLSKSSDLESPCPVAMSGAIKIYSSHLLLISLDIADSLNHARKCKDD